jgi:hypothetical protein
MHSNLQFAQIFVDSGFALNDPLRADEPQEMVA